MAIEHDDVEQQHVWDVLYARLQETLSHFGEEDYTGDADYWIISDNWGSCQHLVYIFNLEMLSPSIVARMQDSLEDHPDWEVVVDVSPKRYGQLWPTMGLILRAHEIVDTLQRQYFPPEFRTFKYEGSRASDG
jgi:hypothetical protein